MFKSLFTTIINFFRSVKGILNHKHDENVRRITATQSSKITVVTGGEKFSWTKWFCGEYRFVNDVKRNALRNAHHQSVKSYRGVSTFFAGLTLVYIVMGHPYAGLVSSLCALITEAGIAIDTGLMAREEFFAA